MAKLKALGKVVRPASNKIDPSLLEIVPVPTYFTMCNYVAHEFTSLCPVTSQPDCGELLISVQNGSDEKLKGLPESKSLKLYLFGFRNVGMFHEEICSRIADDLYHACGGVIKVTGSFAARGGISIRPLAICPKDEFDY